MGHEADLLDVLKPLYIISSIFCVRKYSIRNGLLSHIGRPEIGLRICVNCLSVYLFYLTYKNTEFKELALKLYYIVIYSQHVITFIVISCYNMRSRKVYVALLRKLQEIYTFEKQLSSNALGRNLKIACIVLMSTYIGVIMPKLALDPYWSWTRSIILCLTIIIDYELLFIIFVIRLLALKFKAWSEVTEYLSTDTAVLTTEYCGDLNDIITERVGLGDMTDSHEEIQNSDIEECREEEIQDDSDETKKHFVVFNQLVDATTMMKRVSQFSILYHACTLFTQALVYIAVLIMWIRLADYDIEFKKGIVVSHSAGIIVWIAKALVLQALLGSSMEGLHAAARSSRAAACVLIARRDSTTTRYAKNALRLSACRLHRFTAVGALSVDAALPLRLAALVGSYTVVLLQFALS